MVSCTSCNQKLSAGQKFCTGCGARQVKNQAKLLKTINSSKDRKAYIPTCSQCSEVLHPPWAKFCTSCGAAPDKNAQKQARENERKAAQEARQAHDKRHSSPVMNNQRQKSRNSLWKAENEKDNNTNTSNDTQASASNQQAKQATPNQESKVLSCARCNAVYEKKLPKVP